MGKVVKMIRPYLAKLGHLANIVSVISDVKEFRTLSPSNRWTKLVLNVPAYILLRSELFQCTLG